MAKEGTVTLTRADLASYIASKDGSSVASADEKIKQVMAGIIGLIEERVTEDHVLSLGLVHFGTFKVKKVPPRKGRNPKTGETIEVPAHEKLSFQPSKEFKTKVIEAVKKK